MLARRMHLAFVYDVDFNLGASFGVEGDIGSVIEEYARGTHFVHRSEEGNFEGALFDLDDTCADRLYDRGGFCCLW